MERLGKTQHNGITLLLGRHQQGIARNLLGEFAIARALFEQCHGWADAAHRQAYLMTGAEDPYCIPMVTPEEQRALQLRNAEASSDFLK